MIIMIVYIFLGFLWHILTLIGLMSITESLFSISGWWSFLFYFLLTFSITVKKDSDIKIYELFNRNIRVCLKFIITTGVIFWVVNDSDWNMYFIVFYIIYGLIYLYKLVYELISSSV